MGIFSRIIKSIFLTAGIFLIVVNVIRWSNSETVANVFLGENTMISYPTFENSYKMQDYFGFKWFFDMISTFPGASVSYAMFNRYGNILSMFPSNIDVNNFNVLDAIVGIVSIIFAPALLGITILIDILNNILWFFAFLF